MKKILSFVLLFGGWICLVDSSRALAQQSKAQQQATLYSSLKYPNDRRNACLNLLTGAPAPDASYPRCDVRYGGLYAGDDLDWFQSSGPEDVRSLIKDLGKLDWTSRFKVPVVDPLPKLKPGQHRQVSMNFDGADGADGAPGLAIDSASLMGHGQDESPSRNRALVRLRDLESRPDRTRTKKHGPLIDPPVIVKAQLGHLYVIHVVDDANDFYALVHVEAVERGDHCTISWQIIPAPDSKTIQRK